MADTAPGDGGVEFDPFAGPAILRTSPTTEAQREIWTAARVSSEASLCFNESITLRLTGPVDIAALEASFGDVLARHDALRSTLSEDGLTAMVGDAPASPAVHHNWSQLPEAECEARLAELAVSEVETPFELETGPMFRLHLVRAGSDRACAVLTAHHIVFDGWSVAVLLKEWAALYNARVQGGAADLPEPRSYCDYALDEIEYRKGEAHREDERYWLSRFSESSLPTLELPADRPRPRLRTFAARRHDVKLPLELVSAVRKAGAKQRASLFTTLLAGFEALLFRLSGQEDMVVGIPAAGQSVGGWDNLVGHCVNILPLRAGLTNELPFAELVSALRSTMLDAYDHQRMTFGSLVAQLPIPRDPSRLPLVNVIFNVDRGMPSDAIGFDGIDAQLVSNERHYENFDLFLNAVELPDGVVLECEYNLALFDESTVSRWMQAYERLLRAVAEAPETALGKLPLVSDEERAQIDAWNAAAVQDHPLDTSVSQLIERQVQARPDAIACEFDGRSLSYAELNARANQLARALRAQGVTRGKLVGLSVERSERMLVGLLGILKSGAGYVPLDPGFPRERLDYMVFDAQLAALVTERATHEELSLQAPAVIFLDGDELDAQDASDVHDPEHDAQPEDVAYVIFTSGSTGKPKGVLLPQRAMVNLLCSVARTPGMTADDTVLAVTTLSFDIATSELILPLTVGAKIALASREVASDGGLLLDLLKRSGATFLDATPATYRLLFGAGFEGDPKLKVICTGEAMPKELAQRLVDCVGSLWNGYGPTETTVWSSFHQVEKKVERVLIGRPVDNTRLYVLDDNLQPTPIGVPGALYIAGAGLALGYLGKPELTAERFVPDPFVGGGALMYESGDLARYMPDGQLECLGRTDHQVKLRGYRIELGEIEHALDQHASVAQSTVIVREDSPGDARLVGYLRCHEGGEAADAELKALLKRTLPDYMVPSTFVRLARFPLTPSGKVDRKALPAPDPKSAAREGAIIAPRTETEKLVAELFQEALSVPRVSVDDDFFALGGHSLLASQVLARLRQEHGVSLSFRTIFEAPVVESLAAHIDGVLAGGTPAEPERPPLERKIETGDVAMSVSQERLWLLEEMDPSQELVHNLPAAWRLHGPVDIAILQRALDEIASRHGTLRTHLARVDGKVVQRIETAVELPIEAIDLRDVPEAEREAELLKTMAERTRERFDLYTLPLFRSYLFRVGEASYVYHTVRHNLIWDGWSFDIFLRELTSLYAAFERGEPSPLPPLPVTYGDYVAYQREFLKGPEVARQIDFWRERLSGELPELRLPADRPRPRTSEHAGQNLVVHLGRAQADALTALGREHGTTLFMVLFAGFNAMLHRYSKQQDLLVGTPVRARQRPEFEGLIGPFINAVVLRTQVEPEMRFDELLARVREVTLDSFSHEDMPLEMLGSRPPIVRAFFSFQDARNRPPSLGQTPVEQLHAEPPAAANDLMLWMMETPTDLLAVANYSTELFDRGTMVHFLEGFGALLEAVAKDARAKIASLPIRKGGASHALAHGQPKGELRADPVADFLAAAATRADATALRDAGESLTYGELSNAAGALAGGLVEVEGPVAIHATRATERGAAVLAALAAAKPFALLSSQAPAGYVARQLSRLPGHALWTSTGSDLPSDIRAHRFELGAGSAPLPPASAAGSALACLAQGASPTSRAALATTAASLADALGIEAGETVAWAVPAGSDAELLLCLAALSRGATGLALSPDDKLDRAGVGEIDLLLAPPSVFSRYSDAELSQVGRHVLLGEPTETLAARLLAVREGLVRLHVTTEAGLCAFTCKLNDPAAIGCIGSPLFPARAAVVDAASGPCSEGLEGTLRMATSAPVDAASGPVHYPESPERFAMTSDRARVRADGRFELRGEAEGRLESMGIRFESSEIARCLEEHPAVERAHVTGLRAPTGAVRLTAYLQVSPDESYTSTELRRHVRGQLPAFMAPQVFVEAERWPTQPDGSLDVAALTPVASDEDAPFVPPRSESERLMAQLWQGELDVPRVGRHDNFFALGGHSLLLFKVLDRLEAESGVRLSPRVMLLGSLEQAAVELDTALGRDESAAAAEPARAEPSAPQPPTPAKPERSGRRERLFRKLKDIVGGS